MPAMADRETFSDVLARFGTLTEFARAVGVRPQLVNHWRERGFPVSRCKDIERLTGVSVRRLRPADWQDYWPEVQPSEAQRRAV